ncbi:uncharacterized protein DNG_10126 [Cephalotrichum gorgonifer]|uniref:Uncharacterized protein n=1 Tax=Cephalotrichum gorgonifer TaxID=2041049 RepID=A0AAE8N757_9PEZI|nr:uncharacterized protein DNG_10126 [Cephalotrichum gorgonifer]
MEPCLAESTWSRSVQTEQPSLKLPLPLHAESHPSAPDEIVLIQGFFTLALCRAYLSVARGLSLATTPGWLKRGFLGLLLPGIAAAEQNLHSYIPDGGGCGWYRYCGRW